MRVLRQGSEALRGLGKSLLMKLALPAKVKMIIDSLEAKGFEAYAVGGCVRDLILGGTPQDFDITTNAEPREIKRIFRRTIDTGIEHGTVTVMLGKDGFEVTTYRLDGKYRDGRHPSEVTFTRSLREDLCRRDFTVNAMAYHPQRGLVDLFGGMDDLQKKVIRCVGDPATRFSEDHLRVLRAYRFAAKLGFSIDPATRKAASEDAEGLSVISAERIREELVKLLSSDHPEILRDLYKDGITQIFLPEFDACFSVEQDSPYHAYDVGEHTVRSVMAVPADPLLRLVMLLHDIGKTRAHTKDPDGTDHFKGHAAVSADMAEEILRRLKWDNDTIRKASVLIRYHDLRPDGSERSVRRALQKVTPALFPAYLTVQRADAAAKNPDMLEKTLARIAAVEKTAEKVLARGDALTVGDLAVSGKDLLDAGVPAGPEMGRLLKAALEYVTEDPSRNTKEILLPYLQTMF